MPQYFTDEQKTNLLINNGFDPEKYYFDDISQKIFAKPSAPQLPDSPAPTSDPSSGEMEKQKEQVTSFWEATKNQALASIVPTATGLGGGALGAGVGTMVGGPPGALVGGLIGSIASAYGGEKLQEPFLSEEFKKKLATGAEEHPYGTLLGGVIPSAVTFGNPRGILEAAKAPARLRRLVTNGSRDLTPGELESLKNVALNSGISAGQDIYSQTQDDKPFDPAQLALAAGLGAILNEPTPVGKMLGFKGVNDFPKAKPGAEVEYDKAFPPEVQPKIEEPQPKVSTLTELLPKQEEIPTPEQQRGTLLDEIEKQRVAKETVAKQEELAKQQKLEADINAEMAAKEAEDALKLKRAEDFKKAQAELEDQRLAEVQLETERLRRANEEKKMSLAAGNLKGHGEEAPLAERLQDQMQKAQVTPEREGYVRLSTESSLPVESQTETQPAKTEAPPNKFIDQDPEIFKAQEEQLKRRGVNIAKGVAPGDATALGQALDKTPGGIDRVAVLNESLRRGDTAPHEGGHFFVRELKYSDDPVNAKLYNTGMESVSKKILTTAEAKAESELRAKMEAEGIAKDKIQEHILEERLAQAIGSDGYNRTRTQLYGTAKQKFSGWWDDFKRHFKMKFGLAKDEDIVNFIAQRYSSDAPYGTRPEMTGGVRSINQEETPKQEAIKNEPVKQEEPAKLSTQSTLPDEEGSHPLITRNAFLKPFESAVDKVRPISAKVADALTNFETRREKYQAQVSGVSLYDINKLNPTHEDLSNALKFLRAKFRKTDDAPKLTPKQQKIVDIWKKQESAFRDEQISRGLQVEDSEGNYREAGKSDYYISDMLSDEGIRKLLKPKYTGEDVQAMETWAQYVADSSKNSKSPVTYEEALDNIKKYVSAMGSGDYKTIEFGALRKAKGYGIPEELREDNLLKIIQKYGRRASSDLAYWVDLQNDPEVSALLRLPKREGGVAPLEGITPINSREEVQNAMKFVHGDFAKPTAPRITSAIRAFTNLLLGAPTGIRDAVSLPAIMAPYLSTTKDVSALFKALGGLKEARLKSIEYGARHGNMDLARWQLLENPDEVVTFFNKIGNAARRYQGRELLEQGSRIYNFAVGKELAKNKLMEAMQGNVKAKRWLKEFGTLTDTTNLEKIDLDQVAKNFVDRTQGTYGMRGLPAGAFDSQFAPFFSLSRWGLEKSNVIWKDVVKPAVNEKNFLPLLTYTMGSFLTGAAIRELNQLLTRKKDYTPSLNESLSEDRKDYAVASVINLMQMGSFAGIISDMAKVASDTFIQGEKPRGPINFPMADFLTDTMAQNTSNYFQALKQGEDKLETTVKYLRDIITGTVQNARVLNNQIFERDSIERSNKYRDVRTFKKLEGEDVPALASFSANRYADADVKKFKKTENLEEAANMVPKLLEEALKKSNGDPYKLKAELSKIKANSYQTMPNPDNAPLSFLRYVSYLQKTQGIDEANKRLEDYLEMNEKNRVKSSLIP